MRVSVNQPNLAAGLSIVGRGVSSRSTLPVLGNILLEAKGDQLRLAATNREIGINCWIGAKVEASLCDWVDVDSGMPASRTASLRILLVCATGLMLIPATSPRRHFFAYALASLCDWVDVDSGRHVARKWRNCRYG